MFACPCILLEYLPPHLGRADAALPSSLRLHLGNVGASASLPTSSPLSYSHPLPRSASLPPLLPSSLRPSPLAMHAFDSSIESSMRRYEPVLLVVEAQFAACSVTHRPYHARHPPPACGSTLEREREREREREINEKTGPCHHPSEKHQSGLLLLLRQAGGQGRTTTRNRTCADIAMRMCQKSPIHMAKEACYYTTLLLISASIPADVC